MEYDKAIEHSTRKILYEHIKDNPGITFRKLGTSLKIKEGTMRHHLDSLIKGKLIVKEKQGGQRCYFTTNWKRFPHLDKEIDLSTNQRKILEIISKEPGVKVSVLRQQMKMNKKVFFFNLEKLKEMKLIWRVENENGFGYEIISGDKISNEMFLLSVKQYLNGDIDKDQLMLLIEKIEKYKKNNR